MTQRREGNLPSFVLYGFIWPGQAADKVAEIMENKQTSRLVWQRNICADLRPKSASPREVAKLRVNPVGESEAYFEPANTIANGDIPVKNLYYCGDNYHLLEQLRGEAQTRLDLIYIDPPYMTDLEYRSTISIGEYSQLQHISRPAFQDRWPGGLDSYLEMLFPRLQLMREALAMEGTIFVHVDWHASHYVRVLLDEIFGPENFINEIAWCFGGGSSSRRYFHRKHDLIFWYSRSSAYTYNPQFRPYTQGTLQRGLTSVKGDRYKLSDQGALMQDWWTDISKILSPTARENLKYPTQKPKELLKRLIAAASRPGDLVADFFAGSGTLGEVCNEMGRNWIMADTSKLALQTSLYRLINSGSPPLAIAGSDDFPAGNQPGCLIIREPEIVCDDGKSLLIRMGIDFFQPAELAQGLTGNGFEEYIEFWEIDPDYDQKSFSSLYQVLRPGHRFKTPLPLEVLVRIVPQSSRKIAVKVWDVFANQTLVSIDFPY